MSRTEFAYLFETYLWIQSTFGNSIEYDDWITSRNNRKLVIENEDRFSCCLVSFKPVSQNRVSTDDIYCPKGQLHIQIQCSDDYSI